MSIDASRKILVVDDEKSFTDMLKLSLEATKKYTVRIVNDPNNAILAAQKFAPDLILLDIIMPSMEGPDIAIELKNTPELQNIPIVFLTATVTHEEVEKQGGLIGVHKFVAKPSKLIELIEVIEDNISKIA